MTTDLRDPSVGRNPAHRLSPSRRRITSIGVMSAALALGSLAITGTARGEEVSGGDDAPVAVSTPEATADLQTPITTSTTNTRVLSSRQAALAQASRSGLVAGRFRTKAYGIAYAREWGRYSYKWNEEQTTCLAKLWQSESSWRWNAQNRRSGAYGIPQAKPGNKMVSAGKDWKTNPETQIRWGMGYIKNRYGNPCKALAFKSRAGWY
jgi:hypothetical protein